TDKRVSHRCFLPSKGAFFYRGAGLYTRGVGQAMPPSPSPSPSPLSVFLAFSDSPGNPGIECAGLGLGLGLGLGKIQLSVRR
ncbi:MAG TPA: hypothetical protein VMF89_05120, partial [Polyangiales bacterium]|nr:hypothetical protein [Polyangiales bacterium]